MTNTPADDYTNENPNLKATAERLEMLPPTRQADFQAYLIGAASAEIDDETWNQIITDAHAYASRDPWA